MNNDNGVVLIRGSATGHAHRAVAGALVEENGVSVLTAPEGTRVVHEEHKPVTIPAARCAVYHAREYDHFAEEARRVQD